MSRIDANLAVSLGDVVRPMNQANVVSDQNKQAQVLARQQADGGDSSQPVTADAMHATVQRLNKIIESASGQTLALNLKYDDQAKDLIVQFKDKGGKVIQELPSKELRKLREQMDQIIGLLFDKKA